MTCGWTLEVLRLINTSIERTRSHHKILWMHLNLSLMGERFSDGDASALDPEWNYLLRRVQLLNIHPSMSVVILKHLSMLMLNT